MGLKKNKIILLLILFSSSLTLGQTQNNKDTLYIYFKHHKNEVVKGPRLFSSNNVMSTEYYFWFDKAKDNHYLFFYTTHGKVDGSYLEIPTLVRKNSFLKKNKDRIYTYCDFNKLSPKEIEKFYWDNHNRVVYLIDKKEKKKGEIVLKRVRFNSGFMYTQ